MRPPARSNIMTTNRHPFGPFVRRFLLDEVVADRNLSLNTQRSYRDTLRLLFGFLAGRHVAEPAQVLTEQITADLVRDFLAHLESQRGNSVATRNQRLATIHSIFRFISRQAPELVEHATAIYAIPPRRADTPTMSYLDKREMDALLATPDRHQAQGRRDYAMLLFLYNTGARASEAAAVTVGDLTLDASLCVRLLGKGRKTRICPLWSHTADVLRDILTARFDEPKDAPVFLNVRGRPITRYGIHTLVTRVVKKAAAATPSLQAKRVSPHTIRHTTAVHLLHAGVDINTIRAWLGHVSLETTNRYAEIDMEMKATALETCAVRDPATNHEDPTPIWRQDSKIMEFLMRL
jgi:integrase/recombinase XerD